MSGLLAAIASLALGSTYSVAPVNGDWRFQGPYGERFLSNGVCCVNRGLKQEEWDPLNPGYSASRLFTSDSDWRSSVSNTLRSFGFNTIGAWSDHADLSGLGFHQTPILHLSASGIPWVDPWDPKVRADAKEVARKQIEGWKSLPGVIGYFSDNELGWWYGAMFEFSWKGKPGTPGRRKAAEFFKGKYKSWESLSHDFEPEGAASFEELADQGRLWLKPGGSGMQAVREWMAIVADEYYRLAHTIISELHPDALYLGDRYISNYYPEVVRAAGRHVDVLSTNLNADWPKGDITPYYISGLRELAKKPILITEYYAAAMENQSGNMNDRSGFPTLPTQKERVESFRRQTDWLLSQPDIVGVHWFQYYDEPTHGRSDGENFNMGLVDILGKPYAGLRSAARKSLSKAGPRKPAAAAAEQIPYLPVGLNKSLADWPHQAAALGRTSGEPRGDLFACWNESGILASFYWPEDRFFEAFYKAGAVPKEDQAAFELVVNGKPVAKASLPEEGKPDVEGAVVLDYSRGTRNWLTLRIPANHLGHARLSPGMDFKITGSLSTRARGWTSAWAKTASTSPPLKTSR